MINSIIIKSSILLLLIFFCCSQSLTAAKKKSIDGLWAYEYTLLRGGKPTTRRYYIKVENNHFFSPKIDHSKFQFSPFAYPDLSHGILSNPYIRRSRYYTIENDSIFFDLQPSKHQKEDVVTNQITELAGSMLFKLKNNQLTLFQNGKKLVLTRYEPVTPSELIGNWTFQLQVYSLKSKKVESKSFSVNFSKHRIVLEGNALDCNTYKKNYYILDDQILFQKSDGKAVSTKKKCAQEYEIRYKDNLGINYEQITKLPHDLSFRIEGNQLFLKVGFNDELVLTKS